MSKRSVEDIYAEESVAKKAKTYEHVNKHTLDSDEEDSDVDESRWVVWPCDGQITLTIILSWFILIFRSRYNVMDEEEIQGEEDGVSGMDGDVKVNYKTTELIQTFDPVSS